MPENAPITLRKRIRRAWNWLRFKRGGAVEAAEWYTYSLEMLDGGGRVKSEFRLRQCPKCAALVQPTNENFHDAWHRGGSV